MVSSPGAVPFNSPRLRGAAPSTVGSEGMGAVGEAGGITEASAMQDEPKMMDIVRRAYQLWQENGQPEGKDQEFYFQAEQELRERRLNGGDPDKESPDDNQS